MAHAGDWRRVRRVLLLTLTCATPGVEGREGQVERFFHAVRRRWPDLRYFWWLELTARGTTHWHALLTPGRSGWRGLTSWWCAGEWRQGHVSLRPKPGDWLRQQSGNYVASYAKKMGGKAYQQDYDQVPAGLRTFGHEQLAEGAAWWDAHLEHYLATYVPAHSVGGQHIWEHVVLHGTSGCRLVATRPRSQAPPAAPKPCPAGCVAAPGRSA
jgi:hypothetical protein